MGVTGIETTPINYTAAMCGQLGRIINQGKIGYRTEGFGVPAPELNGVTRMIWRLLGWLMFIYVVLGCLVTVYLGTTVDFSKSGIDWSAMPKNIAVPFWTLIMPWWFPAFVLAALPAPFGFFRRARGQNARALLIPYAVSTLAIALIMMACALYLTTVGEIPTGDHSSTQAGLGIVFGYLCITGTLASPVIAALIALRRRATPSGE